MLFSTFVQPLLLEDYINRLALQERKPTVNRFIILELLAQLGRNILWLLGQAVKKAGIVILFVTACVLARIGFFAALEQWLGMPYGVRRLVGLGVLAVLLINHYSPDLKYRLIGQVRDGLNKAITKLRPKI